MTIQPGVIVKPALGVSLRIRGRLTVQGTASNPVIFESSSSWAGIQFLGQASPRSSVSYAYISRAAHGLENYPGSQLTGDTFVDDGTAVSTPNITAPLSFLDVSELSVIGGATGILYRSGGRLTVSGKIERARVGMDVVRYTRFSDLALTEYCTVGVRMAPQRPPTQAHIADATFYGNAIGLEFDSGRSGRLVMDGSNVIGNRIGLDLVVRDNRVRLDKDGISRNSRYNVFIEGGQRGATVSVPYMWWGTTDRKAIQAKIRDCRVDPTLPCVSNPGIIRVGPPTGPSITVAKPALQHLSGGRWVPTTTVHPGERLRLRAAYDLVNASQYAVQGFATVFMRGLAVAHASTAQFNPTGPGGEFSFPLRLGASATGHLLAQVGIVVGGLQMSDVLILPFDSR